MTAINRLGRELKSSDKPGGSLLMSDVVTGVQYNERPPTLVLAYRGDTPYLGKAADYHVGDVVQYLADGAASVVIGVIPNSGYGPVLDDPDESEEIEAWQAPTLAGSWAHYNTSSNESPGYYKQLDYWVRLKGAVRTGTGTIFTLPDGYRPAFQCYFVVPTQGGAAKLRIETDGDVVHVSGGNNTWLSLDGITFPIAWNGLAWDRPYAMNGWNWAVGDIHSDPAFFCRGDGWVWLKGVVESSTGGVGEVFILPEAARSNWCDALPALSLGFVRLDVGGGGGSTDRNAGTFYNRTGGTSFVFGGNSYFSYRMPDSAMTAPTLTNGWVDYGTDHRRVYYYRDHFNVVHLMGMLNGNGKSSNVPLTLPIGYRPADLQTFIGVNDGGAFGSYSISNAGVVTINGHSTGYFSLGHASFRAMQ